MNAIIGSARAASAYSTYSRPVAKVNAQSDMSSVENRATVAEFSPSATVEISSEGQAKLSASTDGSVTAKSSVNNITSYAGISIDEVRQMYYAGSINYRSYENITEYKENLINQMVQMALIG